MFCLGGLAWFTGKPFIFPSLGPTAFLLSYRTDAATFSAWQVIGGHLWGTVAGLACYHLVVSGAVLMDLAVPLSAAGLRLAASGALATGVTTALMIATRSVHPPACATTLIVSLGLLTTPVEGAIIVGAVTILYSVSQGLSIIWSTGFSTE